MEDGVRRETFHCVSSQILYFEPCKYICLLKIYTLKMLRYAMKESIYATFSNFLKSSILTVNFRSWPYAVSSKIAF